MARTRYRFSPDDPTPYFMTATIVNWLPLFSDPHVAAILIKALSHLISSNRIKLYAYVIMENHVHLIAASDALSKEMGNFKSFTTRQIINYYQEHSNQFLLDQLSFYKTAHKTDRPFQFWQEGSHPQRIEDEAMLLQKVQYIHNNPVKRGYVDLPEHWRYSSARNYAGMEGFLPIVGVDCDE
jgi:putative transposase